MCQVFLSKRHVLSTDSHSTHQFVGQQTTTLKFIINGQRHESEIRGQGNQRVLSLLAASRLALSSRRKISRKTSGTRVSETLSRKVSPPLTSFPSFLNVSFSLYPHESASTWCHWEGSVFTTISLTPRTVFT